MEDVITRRSIEQGKRLADQVITFRNEALEIRQEALRSIAQEASAQPEKTPVGFEARKIGFAPAGVLIAEGDSWFDYPFHDVLQKLEDEHGFDVYSVAHRGDNVEDMAYNGGQLEEFTRLLEKLIRNGQVPRAILLSGGGNDIAGDELRMLLNHVRSGLDDLSESIVRGVIEERLYAAYVAIIVAISEVSRSRIGYVIPIVVHGYAHPVPDGRGFMGGLGPLPGPWLEPAFRHKGYLDLEDRVVVVRRLIDRFNTMLQRLASSFEYVKFVDARSVLSNDLGEERYKLDWANELHPTSAGFSRVAQLFASVV